MDLPCPKDWGLALLGWTRIEDAVSEPYLLPGCVAGSAEGDCPLTPGPTHVSSLEMQNVSRTVSPSPGPRRPTEGRPFPGWPGIHLEHLLQPYLDRLTMYIRCDAADHILTFFVIDTAGDEPGLLSTRYDPQGFEHTWDRLEDLRSWRHLRIMLLATETTCAYYLARLDLLARRPNLARVLRNPCTTAHMTEVPSTKVRDELVDAYALTEQVRLGSTPELSLSEDADLLTTRFCSRATRDLAGQTNRKW